MNTLSESQKKTQEPSSVCRGKNYAYRVGNGIYINLTNRCTNDCTFCIRHNGDGAYGSETLWLEKEPTVSEAFDAVCELYFPECREFVFCGYGEPMMRADTLLKVASLLKERFSLPIRINTNGQAPLICGEDVSPRMEGLIDCVSISLNTPSAEEYVRICKPVYGKKAFEAMLAFASACKAHVPNVLLTVVDEALSKYELAMCHALADRLGVKLRVRTYIG